MPPISSFCLCAQPSWFFQRKVYPARFCSLVRFLDGWLPRRRCLIFPCGCPSVRRLGLMFPSGFSGFFLSGSRRIFFVGCVLFEPGRRPSNGLAFFWSPASPSRLLRPLLLPKKFCRSLLGLCRAYSESRRSDVEQRLFPIYSLSDSLSRTVVPFLSCLYQSPVFGFLSL